jgi:hypothetical protein
MRRGCAFGRLSIRHHRKEANDMAEAITRENLFQFARRAPQTITHIRNDEVRAIVKAETDAREIKSRRLRLARLEIEAQQTPTPTKRRVGNSPKYAT